MAKYRIGFVSNSSSSSFVCDVCNEDYSGWDACMSEAEMFECVNGHTVCESHIVGEIDTDVLSDYPYEVPEKFCPLCSFVKLEDSTALNYLLKSLGKNRNQLLEEIKSKFKNYDEYLEYFK